MAQVLPVLSLAQALLLPLRIFAQVHLHARHLSRGLWRSTRSLRAARMLLRIAVLALLLAAVANAFLAPRRAFGNHSPLVMTRAHGPAPAAPCPCWLSLPRRV